MGDSVSAATYFDKPIVRNILSNLLDISSCGRVNKLWRNVCSDEIFSWMTLYNCTLESLYDNNIIKLIGLESNSFNIVATDNQGSYYLTIITKHCKTQWNHTMEFNVFPFNIFPAGYSEYTGVERLVGVCKVVDPKKAILEIRHQVNLGRLARMIKSEPENVPGRIVNLVKQYHSVALRNFRSPFGNAFTKPITAMEQPEGFKKGMKLYNYQLEAVNWMRYLEDDMNEGLSYYSKVVSLSSKYGTVHLDSLTCTLTENPPKKTIKYRGGVLADEMGLGKTIEVIGLILSSPRGELPPYAPVPLSTFPAINSPEALAEYRKKFLSFLKNKKKPAGGKKKKKIVDDKSEEFANIDISTYLFYVKATLVVCPPHLVTQWKAEIEGHTSPQLKVLVLGVYSDLATLTYRDIVNCDVMVVNTQILTHAGYYHIGHNTPAASVRVSDKKARNNWVRRYLLEVRQEKDNGLDTIAPILDHFHFHRIVFDEFHEFCSATHGFERLNANYFWLVSGTPFPSFDQLENSMQILLEGVESLEHFEVYTIVPAFLKKLVWRNTKLSIRGEYHNLI